MQHLARCLPCQPNPPGRIFEAAQSAWSSCRVNPRSGIPTLNAAACYRVPPRLFYRTGRGVKRPLLLWARGRKHDEPVQTSHYEWDPRDRGSLFSALRAYLLRPETPAKTVFDLLKQHVLRSPPLAASGLSHSDRAVLVEILRRVLDEWSQWEKASTIDYVSPTKVLAFFARNRILGPQDWAFYLNSLSWTAYEAFLRTPMKDLDQRLQKEFDTFLLVRELLRAWKLFFHCYSGERFDLYDVLYADRPGLWAVLQHRPFATVLGNQSFNFNLRLLSFLPGWRSDGESFSDQQLICASMMTIAVLTQSVAISTPTSILLPSTVIDWETSTISAPTLSGNKNWGADPADAQQTTPEPQEAPSALSPDELSLLFIIGQALNSKSINLTLMRVSLAKHVPENRIGQIMSIFSEFKLRLPELLGHATFGIDDVVDSLKPDIVPCHTPTALLTEPISREPLELLVQKVNASQTISEVELLTETYSGLRRRNPRLDSWNFQSAVYKKYLEIGNSSQELKVWDDFPLLSTYKDFWTLRLDFYFRRNDGVPFLHVWARMKAAGHVFSAADYCKRLQLYFNRGLVRRAMDLFKFLRVSGRRENSSRTVLRPLDSQARVSVETFNLMMENLLKINEVSSALAIRELLQPPAGISANDATHQLFFSHWINRGRRDLAISSLRVLAATDSRIGFAPYFKLIRLFLQEWPRSALWADIHLVMETFDWTLGEKHLKSKILRRISVVPDSKGEAFTIKISPSAESDTLTLETENILADEFVEKIPMRADTPRSPAVAALRADFLSLMSAIAEEYPNPKKARIMLISWTYYLLQGLPVLQEMEDRLRTELSQLPFREQLRLLGGDIYQRPSSAEYKNFAYIHTHFGPEFAAWRLESLGFGHYGPLIRKLPWHGFASYNNQRLLEIGVTSTKARILFLDDMNDLYHDLKSIRKEEQNATPIRIIANGATWYLSDAVIDRSGSLQKIPYETLEPESKRPATQRFKLGAAVPKLLGGEMAVRRFKQRMLSRGRKSLTRGRKGVVLRYLRDRLLGRKALRRGRQIKLIYKSRDVVRHRRRDSTRLGRHQRPSAESKVETQAVADVGRKANLHLATRPDPNEIVLAPADFHSMIIKEPEKAQKSSDVRVRKSIINRASQNQGAGNVVRKVITDFASRNTDADSLVRKRIFDPPSQDTHSTNRVRDLMSIRGQHGHSAPQDMDIDNRVRKVMFDSTSRDTDASTRAKGLVSKGAQHGQSA